MGGGGQTVCWVRDDIYLLLGWYGNATRSFGRINCID